MNCDKTDFATKLRMFGPLIIDEGPSLSTTAGSAVAQLMLHWLGIGKNCVYSGGALDKIGLSPSSC